MLAGPAAAAERVRVLAEIFDNHLGISEESKPSIENGVCSLE
jgi:hypothetical protein